ncbi:ClpX C4-type zinc finger protein [Streptomyces althioticus]|uniref:ClpX C4-type zinc finger protein n=1 Tax=Streptomyces althioticus TaxID=83380 RepID=UPI0033C40680
MPNSLAAEEVLTQQVVGVQQFDGARGRCVSMPDDLYTDVRAAARAILHTTAAAIDWPRLLQGAAMRHDVLHPDQEQHPDRPALSEGVCGSCLKHALLSETGNEGSPYHWQQTPDSPTDGHEGVDWPAVVAQGVRHRRDTESPAYCQWCGKQPSEHLTVVRGPGTTICSDCVDLARAVIDSDGDTRRPDVPDHIAPLS